MKIISLKFYNKDFQFSYYLLGSNNSNDGGIVVVVVVLLLVLMISEYLATKTQLWFYNVAIIPVGSLRPYYITRLVFPVGMCGKFSKSHSINYDNLGISIARC